ncbi:hypothetical protein [Prosthecobacter vanneervenii]|uniref:Uncharacterized protein n=1 Tax=Prosthecobacter vanneervenii TaxID=48466 RepID=A0A7W8DKV5_9BACT|nr:hypothetical protein [Prosthecobacter vanneervenii]MBB5033664.1 hypothetical protein [Prosthecobacter vanneervenii]
MHQLNKPSPFWSACARATDFELCNAIAAAIETKYGSAGEMSTVEKMPLHERIPFLIWYGSGFAEKEGLLRLLELPFDRSGWADAYELIEHPGISESLRSLIGKIRCSSAAYDEVKKDLRDYPDEIENTETLLSNASSEVLESLARYIRRQIECYQHLDLGLDMNSVSGPKNLGYLSSAHSWTQDFARKHDDLIPTLEELLAHCMHYGVKSVGQTDYIIPLSGKLSQQNANETLIALRRPIFGQKYCITVAGVIRHITA